MILTVQCPLCHKKTVSHYPNIQSVFNVEEIQRVYDDYRYHCCPDCMVKYKRNDIHEKIICMEFNQ